MQLHFALNTKSKCESPNAQRTKIILYYAEKQHVKQL